MRREVIDRTTTPDGVLLELVRSGSDYGIWVARELLMSSRQRGSEEAMADVAMEALGAASEPRVLVGGLGMGFTLRAVLDRFGAGARVTVAELMPAIVRYNRGPLAHLAGAPLDDPRVTLVEGDVKGVIAQGGWDAILLDIDNGPDALTAEGNEHVYSDTGVRRLKKSVAPDGIVIVWSAAPDEAFLRRLVRAGFDAEARVVSARGKVKRGSRHVLFVGRA
jgi:spermidine synthase